MKEGANARVENKMKDSKRRGGGNEEDEGRYEGKRKNGGRCE